MQTETIETKPRMHTYLRQRERQSSGDDLVRPTFLVCETGFFSASVVSTSCPPSLTAISWVIFYFCILAWSRRFVWPSSSSPIGQFPSSVPPPPSKFTGKGDASGEHAGVQRPDPVLLRRGHPLGPDAVRPDSRRSYNPGVPADPVSGAVDGSGRACATGDAGCEMFFLVVAFVVVAVSLSSPLSVVVLVVYHFLLLLLLGFRSNFCLLPSCPLF